MLLQTSMVIYPTVAATYKGTERKSLRMTKVMKIALQKNH